MVTDGLGRRIFPRDEQAEREEAHWKERARMASEEVQRLEVVIQDLKRQALIWSQSVGTWRSRFEDCQRKLGRYEAKIGD